MPDQPEPAQPSGRSGVLLGETDWWDPPVGMDAVVARIDPANKAKADFDHGVVGITRVEQMTRLGVFTVAHHACSARPSPVTSPPHRGHVSVADRSSETFCVLMGMRS